MPTRSLAPKTTPLSPKAHSKSEKKEHRGAVPSTLLDSYQQQQAYHSGRGNPYQQPNKG
jgi:hypothetical protein